MEIEHHSNAAPGGPFPVQLGFYEGVALSFACIFLSIKVLPYAEMFLLSRSRNMNLYVELVSLERLRDFIALMKAVGIQIFDVELDRKRAPVPKKPIPLITWAPNRVTSLGCPTAPKASEIRE